MTKTRALVVEDSLTVRKFIVNLLQSDPGFEVVGEADNGKTAIELCERYRPDVITLDMALPIMSGLSATEYIMAYCPTPIVIVSASTNRGELFKTYEALAAGAVDVIEKASDMSDPKWQRKFLATVQLASRIKVITHPRARLHSNRVIDPIKHEKYECVCLGASTGGPNALSVVLSNLPSTFVVPIFIVLHISPVFTNAFAEWLNEQSTIPVSVAVDGQRWASTDGPSVRLAPADKHLTLSNGRIRLTDAPEVHSCRPSVDVLFQSVAREVGSRSIAILMTGMGRDGAQGLLAIRQAGGMTIAQDEATSLVYGMPREAVRLNAARSILPLEEIPRALTSLVQS